ncbi:chromatin remodeling complex protein [Trametopsis cervina]|nr:chromatin remodeling complex protein [Trametopsis cervina]
MPTCRRKRVLLTQPTQALVDTLKMDPHKEVFYLAQTGEIFETYEAYAARMSFYRLKQFQCEVTGKSGLDYFQALESEQQEARTMHSRFPEPLKSAVLKSVQWQVIGRLDHLVDAVFDRFKDRYFPDERVFVDIQGDKYYARVVQVFPPRSSLAASGSRSSPSGQASSSSSSQASDEDTMPIHKVAEDLKIALADSISRDDPNKYYYKIQILEEDKGTKAGTGHKAKESSKASKYSGSLMDVRCSDMSRDRLSFSKSILRRFIRECVEREAAIASPWIVKTVIATRYGVDTVMPEETRIGVENLKKGESDKRKKAWEDKEGPPTKRQKKVAVVAEEDKSEIERRDREAQEKAQKAKEESERLAAEKKKKKPIRYPTEDLDITIGDKEKKAGMKLQKPAPSRAAMPFGLDNDTNEAFLMTWNFLVVYGGPLHLSSFTLDEFEQALRHSQQDVPCALISEIHSILIYVLRTVPFTRHSAIISLLKSIEDSDDTEVFGITTTDLIDASRDIGNNWERAPLRHAEGREGWEESLIGCLKDHANLSNFPRLREVFVQLLYAPDAPAEPSVADDEGSRPASLAPNPANVAYTTRAQPKDRYHLLSPEDKIAVLSFMCNLAVSSKAIHLHMEQCEEQLTDLRKQKIEVNRAKKQYTEDIAALNSDKEGDKSGEKKANGEDTPMHDSSDLSDAPGSDAETETGSAGPSARQSVRRAQAKERELARAKLASKKQAVAETRRLDEEVNKCERRLEQIERDFRKLLGAIRVKPLGRDRFYNRVWWFDGMGSASLIGSGGSVQYGTGRIFVQGPSEHDVEILQRREEDVVGRRVEEEGEEGVLGVGEWAVYEELETIDEFVAWLNPKGVRELALKNALAKWWQHIAPGIRRRHADLAQVANVKVQEAASARRSARQKQSGADIYREPYMLWTNRRAAAS